MSRLILPLVAWIALSSAVSAAPQYGSDSCSTPDPATSPSQISYFNLNATTGPEGQGWSMCDFGSVTLIERDVWFLWRAPATGRAQFTSCNSNFNDPMPRFAIYPGAGCPSSIPVECTQNMGCDAALGGWVSFEVEKDSVWLVQVGDGVGSPPATGIGKITIQVLPNTDHLYRYDGSYGGGSSYASFPLNATGDFVWMHRFNAKGGADSLVRIEVAFGVPTFGVPPPYPVPMVDGTPADVAIWSDPDQDGNPLDAVLLASVPIVVEKANTGIPVTVYLPQPVAVQGKFFVGARVPVVVGQSPMVAGDSSWDAYSHSHQAWYAFSSSGPIDLACLGCLSTPPISMAAYWPSPYGNMVVRAMGGADPDPYCFGDGSGKACPCANPGAPGAGCANSSGEGALMWSTGSTKFSADDFALHATQLPPSGGIGLAMAGSTQYFGGMGWTFQDGLLCVSGLLHRFPAKTFTNSFVQESVVSASNGLITIGSTWNFQVWYRDVVGVCGGSTGNLTNALQANFTP
jgi:hypothetical protein